ncbi:cupin domain-containing protein [Nocardioides guangzhouensis]|uniref:Cupin domain-containing protein n=1 Tax=Nocardioides guangzhouensis TaxID=2497878 RepID=A0A4Q4ZH49_9ACTN|nr:cupin domain-containing protein [Nocardioides guangzhouensis]RYP86674.1 cupin domain-containing protein [Nocardioides guangzhouensis]
MADEIQLGAAIRSAREERGLSLREVARRVGVSPSFVSQVETGKANPSVGTLYALVGVLGTSLDDLIGAAGSNGAPVAPAGIPDRPSADRVPPSVGEQPGRTWPPVDVPLQTATDRKRLQMTGVVWERLTHDHDPYVDFLHVEYAPGSASCAPEELMRHGGREYGHVLSGRLEVQIGFETYEVGPGDSIHFDSTTPHRLSNPHDEPCRAIWFVIARSGDDRPTGYA